MKRRGFLKFLGMAAAVPVVASVPKSREVTEAPFTIADYPPYSGHTATSWAKRHRGKHERLTVNMSIALDALPENVKRQLLETAGLKKQS